MPMEPSYSMSIPPPYTTQPLLPLAMPSQWPSMLTTQGGYGAAPLSAAPLPTPHPTHATHSNGPTPRRTLTDADRRRMCLYHEENPHVKQTEIGALFGVERSTVSKVLRQREKYLFPDDGSRSPIKRSKGKFPDIEKALSNWARNHQRQGLPLTDAIIREKAIFFANTVGDPNGRQKVFTSSWLEKFKQKNGLLGAKPRKASVDTVNESDNLANGSSTNVSAVPTPSGVSPVSPNGLPNISPLSPTQTQDGLDKDNPDSFVDFSNAYRHSHSQSATSLDTTPSLSTGVTSPVSSFFSNESPFTPTSQSHLGSNSSRPRSQTFPMVGIDPGLVSNGSSDQLDTKGALQHSMSMSVLESPLEEEQAAGVASGNRVNTRENMTIKRNHSNPEIKTSSMQPPPLPKSNTVSPISAPGSPTQDEARRALELVVNYFHNQPSGLVPQDYVMIGKLVEKLELNQSPGGALPGGLHRIDEHSDGHRVSKKRSIHTL
ncbi:hypothetical protein FQN54_003633 [Arachnomyces sp. PD_36]|nr:hypothetical protein FQN54_003633 [Arachnomyces sp. PD_36]